MITLRLLADIDAAFWAGLATLSLAPLLFGTERRLPSLMLAVAATLYLLYEWSMKYDIVYQIKVARYALEIPTLIVPVGAIASTMLVLALVPQLRIIRFGRLGIGQLIGDINVRFFGCEVLAAFSSAVLICCVWQVAWPLMYVLNRLLTPFIGY